MDSKTIQELRTKYSGELARLEERQRTLNLQKDDLMSKLGITSLDGFDIDAEIQKLESTLEETSSKLQNEIDKYNSLKSTL